MNSKIEIELPVGQGYRILIEDGLLDRIGAYAGALLPVGKAVIVSDSHVYPLYGERLSASLTQAGFAVVSFVFPAGEASKSAETLFSLWRFLAENEVTRRDSIFALGGGVTGDLAGFAAASFLRGIPFVQVPTSLLAMVDSAVGGKTAIDIPEGKNLVGAFYQPRAVLCDPLLLASLPEAELRCGMAEVIKYAFINRPSMLPYLASRPTKEALTRLIAEAIRDKAAIVAEDERDTGVRQLLNFGHTPAHAIELLSDFSVPHGYAVAAGMLLMTRAAVRRGYCEKDVLSALESILSANDIPCDLPYTADALSGAALRDKKRMGDKLTLVIPVSLGKCELLSMPVTCLTAFFDDGLENQ